MKPLIALYKAFRGGEFFEASLRSIAADVDGIVVMASTTPWGESPGENNCVEVVDRIRREIAARIVIVNGGWTRQESQYEDGLQTIRHEFGADSGVLVIDTDEIWRPGDAARLREAMLGNPTAQYFLARLTSYLKSPLYEVWPPEIVPVVVGLQRADNRSFRGRFKARGTWRLTDITFDHFTYVRSDPLVEIPVKFYATSSQEDVASTPDWLTTVWPQLPRGRDLHMTPGSECIWGEIRVVTPWALRRRQPLLSTLAALGPLLRQQEEEWQAELRSRCPADALVPVPTATDREKYSKLLGDALRNESVYLGDVLKTTYLEALWLAGWASDIPERGCILEIGSGHGGSTACLAMGSSETVVIDAVDPFLPYDETTHAGTVTGVHEGDVTQFYQTAERCGYASRLRLLQYDSRHVKPHLANAYDVVFVDGNHTRDIVLADLELSWTHLKSGGLLVGHDFTTRFPGVIQAVDDWGVPVATPPGTSLFYARKP